MVRKLIPFLALLLLASPAGAASDKPSLLGKFGNWQAYSVKEGKELVCYMSTGIRPAAPPKKLQKAKRGKVILMITHRPAENSLNVVSYTAGSKLKPATDLAVSIGPKKFSLFTQSDTAWARDAATDHLLTTAIRDGATFQAKGTTSQGLAFQDIISLKGSSQAYTSMSKACGVKVPEPPKAEKKAEKTVPKKKPSVKKKSKL